MPRRRGVSAPSRGVRARRSLRPVGRRRGRRRGPPRRRGIRTTRRHADVHLERRRRPGAAGRAGARAAASVGVRAIGRVRIGHDDVAAGECRRGAGAGGLGRRLARLRVAVPVSALARRHAHRSGSLEGHGQHEQPNAQDADRGFHARSLCGDPRVPTPGAAPHSRDIDLRACNRTGRVLRYRARRGRATAGSGCPYGPVRTWTQATSSQLSARCTASTFVRTAQGIT